MLRTRTQKHQRKKKLRALLKWLIYTYLYSNTYTENLLRISCVGYCWKKMCLPATDDCIEGGIFHVSGWFVLYKCKRRFSIIDFLHMRTTSFKRERCGRYTLPFIPFCEGTCPYSTPVCMHQSSIRKTLTVMNDV